MPKEKKDSISAEEQPKKGTGSPKADAENVELGGRIDTLEATINVIKQNLSVVSDTNRFILVILFVGFIALLFSVITANIQAINASTNAQIEFTRALQQIIDALPKKQ